MNGTPGWTSFAYLVVNLARQIRPGEIVFSGVNSTLPMLACLLAKRAYDFHYTYINVAGGVEPNPWSIPHSSSDPALVTGSMFYSPTPHLKLSLRAIQGSLSAPPLRATVSACLLLRPD